MIDPSFPASSKLDELLHKVIELLVDKARRHGGLELNWRQVFCLIAWSSGSGRPRSPTFEAPSVLTTDQAYTLFTNCVSIAQYTYHPEVDAFAIAGESSGRGTQPQPALVPPGSGILDHVARTRRPYRTRMSYADLRTQNVVDNVQRGIGDVMYGCAESSCGTSFSIISVSAPAPGLLDGLTLESLQTLLPREAALPLRQGHTDHRPVSIWFERAAQVNSKLLHDLVFGVPPTSGTTVATSGVVLATLRQRGANHKARNYEWERRIGDFSPVQVARAIIRVRHLGSLFDSYRTEIHDQVERWSASSTTYHTGDATPSGAPGMAAYDQDLHRVAIRVHDRHGTYSMIRAGFAAKPSPDLTAALESIESVLGACLGALISSLRRWFRGTVARTHLCWDLERSLLTRIADHLAGTSPFVVAEFQSSVALLHCMLAEMEVDPQDAQGLPARIIESSGLAKAVESMYGKLSDSVVVVPWVLRLSYRVADARELAATDDHHHGVRDAEPFPRPAIYVAIGNDAFHLVGEDDQRRTQEHRSLAGAASSRDYIVALQSLLSSLLASRPTVGLLRWRTPTPTVDLLQNGRAVETVTLDLPLANHRLGWIEIVHASPECVITLHHNSPRPFYHPHLDHGSSAPGSSSPLRAVLERNQALKVAFREFRAVAVVWNRAELAIPLAIALPHEGEPLRNHLIEASNELRSVVTTKVSSLNASFSFDYAPTILRHGWYHAEALHLLIKGAARLDDLLASGISTSAADTQFITEYIQSQFRPAGSDPFPFGLKPFGRQFHVFPVTTDDGEPQTLSIVTNWEQERTDAILQSAHLHKHVESVVAEHGGRVIEGGRSADYTKYENGCQPVSVDPMHYDLVELGARYDVAVVQRESSGSAKLNSQRGGVSDTLSPEELRVLLNFVTAPLLSWTSRDDTQKRHFRNMRHKLEPTIRLPPGRAADSPYWKVLPARDQLARHATYRFDAPSFIIIVPRTTVGDR